ncbi:MAG: photosynthetic complex putative assembly protein PuhB [Pseudomonadota bacterium]
MSAAPSDPSPTHRPADDHDFDVEPVRGLPEALPEGERILWQGEPSWRRLARQALWWRVVATYFAVIAVWRGVGAWMDGGSPAEIAGAAASLLLPALLSLGLLALLAYALAKTTVYTITDARIVMRMGLALQITVNLPFAQIGAAGVKKFTDGTGDIPLTLSGSDRFAYLLLWPHARPWHFSKAEPMLRAVPEIDTVAELLADALTAAQGRSSAAPSRPPVPAAAPSQSPFPGAAVAAE